MLFATGPGPAMPAASAARGVAAVCVSAFHTRAGEPTFGLLDRVHLHGEEGRVR